MVMMILMVVVVVVVVMVVVVMRTGGLRRNDGIQGMVELKDGKRDIVGPLILAGPTVCSPYLAYFHPGFVRNSREHFCRDKITFLPISLTTMGTQILTVH